MSAYISILNALGWSLLNSIWQMGILWTVYLSLTVGNKRFSATGKHNLALVFVFIGAEWFVYTFIRLINEPATPLVPGFIPGSAAVSQWIPFVSMVYLLVLGVRYLQSAFHYFHRTHHLNGGANSPVLQSFTDRHVRLLGIPNRVQVYLSEISLTAETCGFFKPIILLPVSLITRLTTEQVEAILIHELFHIRRNDYLINICMSFFRSIFFFNPFARLFYTTVSRERELACDDGVMEMGYAPELYAEALYNLEKFRQVHPGFSLAADGNRPWLLMERIRRVLGKPAVKKNRVNAFVFLNGFAAIFFFGLQQKNPSVHTPVPTAVYQSPLVPAPVEFVQEKISNTEAGTLVKTSVQKKNVRIKAVTPLPARIVAEPVEEAPTSPNTAYFAENKTVRNFSNQRAVASVQDPVQEFTGTPFVPSVSLSYEALPEILSADSIHYVELVNGLNDLVRTTRIKTIIHLEKAGKEIDKNRKALKEIEIKNRKLILLDQKNIQPVLDKMQRRILNKKREIERLQIRLQQSEEEIIHI